MHTIPTAIQAVKAFKGAKFDESVDATIHVNKAVSGSFAFPCGLGKSRRVVCFVEGPDELQALAAGAIAVGGADLATKIRTNQIKFDVVVAHPKMMSVVGPLGMILKEKMPNPSVGSLTDDVVGAVKDFHLGKVSYRSDKDGNVSTSFGRKSFSETDLIDNLSALVEHLRGSANVEKVSISATMSPSVEVKI